MITISSVQTGSENTGRCWGSWKWPDVEWWLLLKPSRQLWGITTPLSTRSLRGRAGEQQILKTGDGYKTILVQPVQTATCCTIIPPDCVKGIVPQTTNIVFQRRTSSRRAASQRTAAPTPTNLQLQFREETGKLLHDVPRCWEFWTVGVLETSSALFRVVKIYLVWHVTR